ncbi:MAG: DUF4830 domain-containing protein [Clostridia bacterium]|nr:DUF4830 domain-containing protein [Clostridia bacterium]
MFVYSVRGSTVKFALLIVITLLLLSGILIFGSGAAVEASVGADIKLGGMKTNEDRLEFISQFGISVAGEPKSSETFSVPADFDRIIAGYNEIQKSQGLDIGKYKNKKVTRYTYSVSDYEGYDGEVNVNLIIYKNTVIACDVSSEDPNGFVKPLIKL